MDELGEVEERITALSAEAKARLKPYLDRRAKLLVEAQKLFAETPADESATVEGNQFLLTAGKKEREREIIPAKIPKLMQIARMTAAKFVQQFCTIRLGAVDKFIPAEKHEVLMRDERTGPRTVTVVRKQQQAVESASSAATLVAGSSSRRPQT